ncbi:MAG: ABC transporter substrate-binding protein [Acidimicrobiia bacterium]|jgi:ABC-type branched-subunit amino acid transport system substrate-binding protein
MTSNRVVGRTGVLVALLVSAVFVGSAPVAAQDEKPVAGEIGITENEIRVAVVADVESPLAPGQFKSQVDAMRGYAKYVNARDGIAGRKLVVDFIDSKLNPDESRNATIKACSDDLAMVGTAVVFMTNVDDMVGCADSTGAATGLPDINTFTQELVHQCSPVSYSVSPPQLDCNTKDDHVKKYRAALGQIRYYLSRHKDLHGICVGPNDLKSTATTGRVHCAAARELGIKHDGEGFYGISARAPQTAMTPIVGVAKVNESTYVNTLLSYSQVISMRKEAKLQGLNSVEVWDCSRTCYSEEFLAGGADVEGNYVFLNTLPLDEGKSNKAMAAYIKAVGRDNADAFGETAWAAAILFHESIDKIVERDGVNGITRAKLLDELSKTKSFDADGMLATTDVGNRVPSDCYNLSQVKNGDFVRVHPKKAGTFDCSPKNVVTVEVADE